MSSLVTTAAPVNYDNENNNTPKEKPIKQQSKAQTYKNKPKKIDKAMLEDLYNNDSDDELPMGDFTPVQKPLHNLQMTTNSPSYIPNDMPVNSPKDFGQLNNTMSANYHQQYIDNYNKAIQSTTISNPNNELLKKLDNILFLLEEQKEEQTHLITEELILYVFLGVFIIYVLDSFVKVGKYVR